MIARFPYSPAVHACENSLIALYPLRDLEAGQPCELEFGYRWLKKLYIKNN
jgi:hypothetical protein